MSVGVLSSEHGARLKRILTDAKDAMMVDGSVRCPVCKDRHDVFDIAKTDAGLYRVLQCKSHKGKPYVKLRGNRKYGTIVLEGE